MGDQSGIQWTDATLNPIRARHRVTDKVGWICVHKSAGCVNCYAEKMNGWRGNGEPFTPAGLKNVELFLDETILTAPLRWRNPRRIFVCSMTDLFWEQVPDEWIDRIFAVMALCPQHTFQVLTKRPDEMRSYMTAFDPRAAVDALLAEHHPTAEVTTWPLPNVHLGVSVENQEAADERIPLLLQTPAAVRFLSVEPLLGPVDINRHLFRGESIVHDEPGWTGDIVELRRRLHWVIVGGESGPGARPCDLAWIRSVVAQCKAAGTPCFVKQLGARPVELRRGFDAYTTWVNKAPTWVLSGDACFDARGRRCAIGADFMRARDEGAFPVTIHQPLRLRDRKGGDMSEWPEDLRVREFPRG